MSVDHNGLAMYSFDELDIQGHKGRVPNEYLRLKTSSDRYAMTFPGRGYTTQAPLLYYTNRFLLHRGINVLNINYDYLNNQDFAAKTQEEQMRWLRDDVVAAYDAAEKQLGEELSCLVGKSLGTIALAIILKEKPSARELSFVWHTPLILLPQIQSVLEEYTPQSLFVIGTNDPYYEEEVLSDLVETTGGMKVVIEEANHGMEVATDPLDLLETMRTIMNGLDAFFGARA